MWKSLFFSKGIELTQDIQRFTFQFVDFSFALWIENLDFGLVEQLDRFKQTFNSFLRLILILRHFFLYLIQDIFSFLFVTRLLHHQLFT